MPYAIIDKKTGKILSFQSHDIDPVDGILSIKFSNEDILKIDTGTHVWDTDTKAIVPAPAIVIRQKEEQQRKQYAKRFLHDTDWQVLRHIREQVLSIPTTLTQDQYLALEKKRHEMSKSI